MNFRITILLLSALTFMLTSACQSGSENAGVENESKSTTGMLQHTVYFYLNDDVTPEQAQEFENGLRELLKISSIYKSELGVPGDTEQRDVTDHSFGYSIFTWFENLEDYKIYDEHPDHLDFIDRYNSLWMDVKVYDSELINPNNY